MTSKENLLIGKLDCYYDCNGVTEQLKGWINKLIKDKKINILKELDCIKNNEFLLPIDVLFIMYNCHTDDTKLLDYAIKFQFALSDEDYTAIENKIIEFGIGITLYKCAKFIKRSNKQNLQEALLTTNDATSIYMFADDIKGADVKLCQTRLMNILEDQASSFTTFNPFEIAYKFLRDVPNADAETIINFLSNTDYFKHLRHTGEYIYLTALHYVQNIRNKELRSKYINTLCTAEAKSAHPEFIYMFALNIKGANIEELENALIEPLGYTANKYLYLFAKNVKGANINKIQKAMAEKAIITNATFEFARNINSAYDITKRVDNYNNELSQDIESCIDEI